MPIKNIASALLLTVSLSGCTFLYDTFVYQIDVTQGNYIEDAKIAQLELGMTQEQVIFILGSPMLIDQFDASKWYYIRYIKPGGEKIQQQQVLLVFTDKVLTKIENNTPIKESPLAVPSKKKEPNKAAESSAEDEAPKNQSTAPDVGA